MTYIRHLLLIYTLLNVIYIYIICKIQKYYIFNYWVCYAALFITLNLSRRPHLTEVKFAHAQSTRIQTFVHVGQIKWRCHSAAVFWCTTRCMFSTPHPSTDLDSPSVIAGIFLSCLSCFSFIQAPSWLLNIVHSIWSAASFFPYLPQRLPPHLFSRYFGIYFHSDWLGRMKGAGSPSGNSCHQMACGYYSARSLCWCCRLVRPWVMLALAPAICYVCCWGVCSGKPVETELIHMFKLGGEFWLVFADTEASKATWRNLPICYSLASRNLLRKVTLPMSLGSPPLPSPPFLPFLFSSHLYVPLPVLVFFSFLLSIPSSLSSPSHNADWL